MKKKIKAFIIEDDKIAWLIIKNILKSDKKINSSEFYSNGLLAIEKLKIIKKNNEILPDFILLDFDMPIMNGLEFLKNIKDIIGINQIPIFMNSASHELVEYRLCLEYENVKGNFSKPFTTESLTAILELVNNLKNSIININ